MIKAQLLVIILYGKYFELVNYYTSNLHNEKSLLLINICELSSTAKKLVSRLQKAQLFSMPLCLDTSILFPLLPSWLMFVCDIIKFTISFWCRHLWIVADKSAWSIDDHCHLVLSSMLASIHIYMYIGPMIASSIHRSALHKTPLFLEKYASPTSFPWWCWIHCASQKLYIVIIQCTYKYLKKNEYHVKRIVKKQHTRQVTL